MASLWMNELMSDIAHNTGGLGVASSNLAAPTKFSFLHQGLEPGEPAPANDQKGTEGRRKSRSGAESPVKVPWGVLRRFRAYLMQDPAVVTREVLDKANARAWLAKHAADRQFGQPHYGHRHEDGE